MLTTNEKFRQLSLNIKHYRNLRGYTQDELAEKAHISRSHLSHIESPNIASSYSLAMIFNIADALDIEVSKLFEFHE